MKLQTEEARDYLRVEDERLLRGQGRFVGDLSFPGMRTLVVLRSLHAHAAIRTIDAADASALDGVDRILTGADLEREAPGLLRAATQPALAFGEVVYAGQPVVAVLARDRYLAEDAVDRIRVRYERLRALTDAEAALRDGADPVRSGQDTNVQSDVQLAYGDIEEAFARADIVLEERLEIGRATAQPLEGRAILALPEAGGLTVYASHQAPHLLRSLLAQALLLPEERVRVITPDVGGGFGPKNGVYPEDLLATYLAIQTGWPVRFLEDRSESFLATTHARQQVHRVRLAARKDGTLLGLDDLGIYDVGAFPPRTAYGLATATAIPGPYHLPAYLGRVLHVHTNKTPVGAYRGAGRPEGNFVMERMMDRLAATMGMDPASLRLKNMVGPDEMPYHTGLPFRGGPQEVVFDSGDYPEALRAALAAIGIEGWRARQAELRALGRHIGIGVSAFVEDTGVGGFEEAVAEVLAEGHVRIATGSPAQGQGHETVFSQIASDVLGVPRTAIEYVGTDTAQIPGGIGTFGSRGVPMGGSAVYEACQTLRGMLLVAAAQVLHASQEEIALQGGAAHASKGAVPFAALRKQAGELRAHARFESPPTFANGVHAVVAEVDPETGGVAILRYVMVDDCGRILNPLLVDGQLHGGISYGLSAALLEELVYDERGQLLTGSFMDYLIPTMSDMPEMEILHHTSPSPHNPLGAKGAGEGGTIPALAAIASAVEDALRPFGAVVRQLPLNPARVRALAAGATQGRDDDA